MWTVWCPGQSGGDAGTSKIERALELLLEIDGVGVDRVVGQVDRVQDVNVGVQSHGEIGGDLEHDLAP